MGRLLALAACVGLTWAAAGAAASAELAEIEGLKDRQQGMVEAVMRRQPAFAVASTILGELDRTGSDAGYDVRVIPGTTPRVGITVRLGVGCGSDNLLMIFEHQAGVWVPVMIRRSRPYRDIADAWEELRYDLSEPDLAGRWFLVTASVQPWCASAVQRVRFDASRPGKTADAPAILLSRIDRVDAETPAQIEAGRNVFTLHYDGRSLDPDIGAVRRVQRFSVIGDAVRRVDPIATTPRDFVDEWIRAPWSQASRWSEGRGLQSAHAALAHESRVTNSLVTFAGVSPCRGGGHQVEISTRRFEPARARSTWFARVSGDGRYRMRQVSRTPFAACSRP